jgi:hypothetical protein
VSTISPFGQLGRQGRSFGERAQRYVFLQNFCKRAEKMNAEVRISYCLRRGWCKKGIFLLGIEEFSLLAARRFGFSKR